MNDINIFDNSKIMFERKSPFLIVSWITILIIFTIIFLIMSIFYEFNRYKSYYGKINKEGDKYYVQLFLEESAIYSFQNDTVLINKKIVSYKIESISDEYYDIGLKHLTKEMIFQITDNYNDLSGNSIIEVVIESPKTTVLKQIIKRIKKGGVL